MYRCYNPKRCLHLLILDAAVLALWFLFCAIGKSVFSSEQPKEGVFLPIVMYHSITEQVICDDQITPHMLEEDLAYLEAHGYETVLPADLVDYVHGRKALPEKPVMLTFDDGFYNNLSAALPLLEEYGMCAVVSVVGSFTEELAVADPHVPAYSYLTWEDIRTLLDSGRIEIGSHTYDLHHNDSRAGCSIMYGESVERYTAMLTEDISRLQQRMQEETGFTPISFAYPYGYICKESLPILQNLGFTCTFTCYERPNYIVQDMDCLYGLDRYHRGPEESTAAFFERVLDASSA